MEQKVNGDSLRELYEQNKSVLIKRVELGKCRNVNEVLSDINLFEANNHEYAKNDSDIAYLKVMAETSNFSKIYPIKKAKKIVKNVLDMPSDDTTQFAMQCRCRTANYLDTCAISSKRGRRKVICIFGACLCALSLLGVGAWYGDNTGLFYGKRDLKFIADGQEINASDVVRYNNFVQVDIPSKMGYDTVGIFDTTTGRQLFDSNGKSLSTISERDLSDYSGSQLVVQYSPHVYSATVRSTTGAFVSTVSYTVEDEPEDVLEEPQKLDGYVFDGWYTDSKYKNLFTGNFSDYTDDTQLTLYPHYSLDGWQIKWELNGGEFVTSDVLSQYNILTDVSLPDNDVVKRVGYTLKGWSLNGKMIDHFTATTMKDVTLSAVWIPINYSITYDLAGGNLYASAEQTFTIEDEFALPIPTRAAYTFIGWYTNRAFTQTVESINQGTINNKTFYAKWKANEYSIKYELCGGQNNSLNPTTYTAEQGDVNLYAPTKTGYEFVSWTDVLNGQIKDTISAVIDGNIKLKANWKIIEYSIRYNLNGGELDESAKTTYTVEDGFSIDIPTKTAYSFCGWYSSKAYTEQITEIHMGTIGNKVFYAKWVPIEYSIGYVLDGGQNNIQNPSIYTAESDITLRTPTRTGYKFICWTETRTGEDKVTLSAMIDGDVELAAVWEALEYTITVYPNNGQNSYIQKVKYGEYYSIAVPTYAGYTFNKYMLGSDEVNCNGIYNYATDIVVIANYIPNTYSITYISDDKTVAVQTVTYGQAYTLNTSPEKLNYEFVGWFDNRVGGSKVVDGVYQISSNTTVYANWIKVLTINLSSNSEYVIDKTIDKAYVIGNYNGLNKLMTNINIKVTERDNDLTIQLKNAGFKAKNDCIAIDCDNSSYTLTIINVGTSYIEGGDGSKGSDGVSGGSMNSSTCHGRNGNDSQHALNCGTVVFESLNKNSSLTLKAGDAGAGGNGGVDTNRARMWLNYTPNGGNGGSSKSALNCVSYSVNGTTVNFIKGAAGKGGKAGSRANWWTSVSYGSDGRDGAQANAVTRK